MKALGFTSIEVNYKVTESMIEDVLSLVQEGEIEVCSLHNFTPIPVHLGREKAAGDLFMLSALDKEEREKAIQYTKRTIDFAHQLGAQAVVLHLGAAVRDIGPPKRLEQRLKTILKGGDINPLEVRFVQQRLEQMRRAEEKERLKALLRSLEELVEYAHNKGVKLGAENRFHYFQIPNFEEMGQILNHFPEGSIYYWHDMGHAQVLEFLGFGEHEAFLQEYGGRMLGIHIHDCRGDEDHLAPGMGEVDFGIITPYLTPGMIKVMELKDTIAPEQVLNGLKFLNDCGIQ